MYEYICLDSSVLIKVLVPEESSDCAVELMNKILLKRQRIVLPSFAWAEIGSILRKRCMLKQLRETEADELWLEFVHFSGIYYLENKSIIERSWRISRSLDLPTLYDSAFLAVAEIISDETGSHCEFWTADEKLVRLLKGRKKYVKLLKDLKFDSAE